MAKALTGVNHCFCMFQVT